MNKTVVAMMLAMASLVCVTSCSQEEPEPAPTLDKYQVTVKAGQSTSITYKGSGACQWSSDEPRIASVNDGVITGVRVGKTKIHANDLVCDVTVTPQYSRYYEPCTDWGCSKNKVESYMYGYSQKSSSSGNLLYTGTNSVIGYGYQFDDNNKLEYSYMFVKLSDADYIADFLGERYVYAGQEGECFIFFSVDHKTFVTLVVTYQYLGVAYTPYESSTKSCMDLEAAKDLINAVMAEFIVSE